MLISWMSGNFHREQSRKFQMEYAKRMVKRRKIELALGHRGGNGAIPIPLVDQGRGDPRNILAVILDGSKRLESSGTDQPDREFSTAHNLVIMQPRAYNIMQCTTTVHIKSPELGDPDWGL
ncbi:hypothetical protein RRG08_044079 [Elysia crispata]|uniref:Uncharacterized protein n=1 Tax=Elysia crispata TaxID=231223 RepID=A0AAE1B3P0_9GAST|nr:hypothetical protein RRG08_044079 [Elysia crispata]